MGSTILDPREQAFSRIEICDEEAAEAIIHWLFQVQLAAEVTLGRQDRGVPEKELYLLKLAAIHMAGLRITSKIMRCEVIKLHAPRAAPNHVPGDVLGNADSPRSPVTTHCPEHSPRRPGCGCLPPVYGTFHPQRHGNCRTGLNLAVSRTLTAGRLAHAINVLKRSAAPASNSTAIARYADKCGIGTCRACRNAAKASRLLAIFAQPCCMKLPPTMARMLSEINGTNHDLNGQMPSWGEP
jgi:hypothetical protein